MNLCCHQFVLTPICVTNQCCHQDRVSGHQFVEAGGLAGRSLFFYMTYKWNTYIFSYLQGGL